MGAWGHRTFEDDTSLDQIEDWMEAADPIDQMAQAIETALASQYLDYTDGHSISVAAAVLDYALVGTDPEEDTDLDGLQVWLEALGQDRLRLLLPGVLSGLDRLLGEESELAELWAENEEAYPAWRQVLLDRQVRLSGLAFAA